jgi:hypothetical protein
VFSVPCLYFQVHSLVTIVLLHTCPFVSIFSGNVRFHCCVLKGTQCKYLYLFFRVHICKSNVAVLEGMGIHACVCKHKHTDKGNLRVLNQRLVFKSRTQGKKKLFGATNKGTTFILFIKFSRELGQLNQHRDWATGSKTKEMDARFLVQAKDFSLFCSIQTDCWINPAFCSGGGGGGVTPAPA